MPAEIIFGERSVTVTASAQTVANALRRGREEGLVEFTRLTTVGDFGHEIFVNPQRVLWVRPIE